MLFPLVAELEGEKRAILILPSGGFSLHAYAAQFLSCSSQIVAAMVLVAS